MGASNTGSENVINRIAMLLVQYNIHHNVIIKADGLFSFIHPAQLPFHLSLSSFPSLADVKA